MAKQPFRSGGFGPDATGGSRTGNLLAGLGKFAIDSISGKRNMLLKQVDRANEASMNLAADRIARDEMMKLIPTLQSQNVKRFGRQGMEFQPTYTPPTPKPGSGTKGTKGKGGAKPKGKGKTTNTPTTDPDTSTSEMKDTGKKSGKTPSGKKPGAKSSSKEIATAGFTGSNRYKDTPEEAFDINKRAGLNPTTGPGSVPPKAKKTAKPKKPSTPKNGNSGSTNGNKKGGM